MGLRFRPYRIEFEVEPKDILTAHRDLSNAAFAEWALDKTDVLLELCRPPAFNAPKYDPNDPRRFLCVEQPRSLRRVQHRVLGGTWYLKTCVLADESAEQRLEKLRAFFEQHDWLVRMR